MSHKANNNFYESLTEAIEEKQITVRELFDFYDDGALTKDELHNLLSKMMNPETNPLPEQYEINGHPVTKERYEEWMKHNG